jgi:hypothetical protein
MIRPPAPEEVGRLEQLRMDAEKHFSAGPSSVAFFLETCNASENETSTVLPHEFAAYIVVASALINLDESITRD